MQSSEDYRKALAAKVEEIQAIIDANEAKGNYSFVSEPAFRALEAEERKLRKAFNEAWKDEYNAKAMNATGLKPGDRVSYFSLSWTGLGASTWYGTIVLFRGKIRVKVDEMIEGKRYFQVNKGWKKLEGV